MFRHFPANVPPKPKRYCYRHMLNSKLNFRRATLIGLLLSVVCFVGAHARSSEPLRVFIRAGVKTHGPDQHDHPRFLKEWTTLLRGRGMQVDGALNFPTAAQLDVTDVLIIYAQDGMKVSAA